jgi:hypothetical protein
MEFMHTNGIDLRTGKPLFSRVPFDEFMQVFRDRLPYPREDEERRRATTSGLSKRRRSFAARTPNLNDPTSVGYGVICAPGGVALLDGALAPLLRIRQVKPEHRVVFDQAKIGIEEMTDWLDEHFSNPDGPYYWLLVGGPGDVPFDLQWMLDAGKATGRIDFTGEAEYAGYAQRVVEAEEKLAAVQGSPPAFFWSTLHDDATRLSNWYMCTPLVKKLQSDGLEVAYCEKSDATVAGFWEGGARLRRAGLVFTASHGGALPKDDPEQASLQGALVAMDGNVAGEQVAKAPSPFPGSVMFNFACYSGGTPAHSDFNHWVPQYNLGPYIPEKAFVSHLHRRLVAAANGPLAAIGHVEPAWVHSFADPEDPDETVRDPSLDTEWGERMQPFKTFVDRLVKGYTVGYAMELFGFLYDRLGNEIARRVNRYLRDTQTDPNVDAEVRKMVALWISRNDYQNYVVFGDPAVRIA